MQMMQRGQGMWQPICHVTESDEEQKAAKKLFKGTPTCGTHDAFVSHEMCMTNMAQMCVILLEHGYLKSLM